MAKLNVNDGRYNVDSLYQWDRDQVLEIRGLSLPSIPEIHFANETMKEALVVQASMDGSGVITCDIPNPILEKPHKIKAYICTYEGQKFQCLYEITIPVKPKAKPGDYFPRNDEEIYSYNSLANLINNAKYYLENTIDTIEDRRNDTINHIDETRENAVNEINETRENAVNKVNETLAESLDQFENTTREQIDEAIDGALGQLEEIAVSTTSDLTRSKPGGIKINYIAGASVQNGTPTPDNPLSIKNAFETVDVIQGHYNNSGVYETTVNAVCNKYPIPCNSGDVIKISVDDSEVNNIYLRYYNESGWVSNAGTTGTEVEYTVPSGVTKFNFEIGKNNVTPSTIGKITLIINGEYLVPIKTIGKNLLDLRGLSATTTNGITFTPVYDSNGDLEYINANGTSTNALSYWVKTTYDLEPGKTYTFSGCPSSATVSTYRISILQVGPSGERVGSINEVGSGASMEISETQASTQFFIWVNSGIPLNNVKFYPMIRNAEVTDATYEPYKERNVLIKLSEPLGNGDILYKENGVWKKKIARFSEEIWVEKLHSFVSSGYGNYVSVQTEKTPLVSNAESVVLAERFFPVSFDSRTSEFLDKARIYVDGNGKVTIRDNQKNAVLSSLDDFRVFVDNNPFYIEYRIAEPIIEELPLEDQMALNSLETFDEFTRISFDSMVDPSFEVEYGRISTSSYAIKAFNQAENALHTIEFVKDNFDAKENTVYTVLSDAVDFNTLTTPGRYYCTSNYNTNAPTHANGFLDVLVSNDERGTIKHIYRTETVEYTRIVYNGLFNRPWYKTNERVTEFELDADNSTYYLFDCYYGVYLVTFWRPALSFRQVSMVFCNCGLVYAHTLVRDGEANEVTFDYDADMEMVSVTLPDYGDGSTHTVYVSVLELKA